MAAFMAFASAAPGKASADLLEGDLQPIMANERTGAQLCGKFFFVLPATNSKEKPGVAFTMLMMGRIPTHILTAVERVTVTIDESRQAPWASVEFDTGMYHAQLKISSAGLTEATCLKGAKRA